jgi:hypothetical protein
MEKETKKKNTPSLDFGTFLLITGALANVTLWIGAFVSTEAQGPVSLWIREFAIPVLGGISGLSMGITVAAGLVFVLSHLSKMPASFERKVRGKDEVKTIINFRFYGAAVAIVLLILISPLLLAPYVYMTIADKASLFEVLGTSWSPAWSVGRILAADLALGAIALVHGVQFGAAAGPARATDGASTAAHSDGGANSTPKKSAKVATDMRACDLGCGMTFKWPQGKGAHMKKYHPELCVVKGTPAAGIMLPAGSKKSEKVEKK